MIELDGDVHALLDLDVPDASAGDVLRWVRPRLPAAQVPGSAEAVDGPLRDDAGKLNRQALREARRSPRREATGRRL